MFEQTLEVTEFEAVDESQALLQLADLQLACVGGGIGNVTFA